MKEAEPCLAGLMIVAVKYYVVVHSMLHLDMSSPRAFFIYIWTIFYYVFKQRHYWFKSIVLFYTDENINYVNCVWSAESSTTWQLDIRACGELCSAGRPV